MERPRLVQILFGAVLLHMAVAAIFGTYVIVDAKHLADVANEDKKETTTTTTTTAPASDATDATDSGTSSDNKDDDEVTPGAVRIAGSIAIVSGLVTGWLGYLIWRRDPRGRLPLMILLAAMTLFGILGVFSILTLVVALFAIYVVQFDRPVKAWLVGPRGDAIDTTAVDADTDIDDVDDEDDRTDEPPDDARPGYRWPRRPR